MIKEIERKFILRNIPQATVGGPGSILDVETILQVYDGDWRYRKHHKNGHVTYYKMTKTGISPGISEESDPLIITPAELIEKMDLCPKTIKHRYVFQGTPDGVVFEVDQFHNITLVMLEVEIPSLDYPITIPPNIQREIIAEVTGMKEFSNKNLATR